MDRNENISQFARLVAMVIFLLMLISFILHLCAFGEIIFRHNDIQSTEISFQRLKIRINFL